MDDFSLLELFLSMLWFFLFVAWIFLLAVLATDIFRSPDMSGWAKALWVFCLVLFPVVTAVVYLGVRGGGMSERQRVEAERREEWIRAYVRDVAATPGPASTADEIEKLARLRDAGTLTDDEFSTQKAKLLHV